MRRRYLFISALAFVFVTVAIISSITLRHDSRLSIVLITVESLRADMVTGENCPNLLDAGKSGFHFKNYRAISGWTGSNIVSLLSGLTPFQSGVHTRGQSVDPNISLPLEQLSRIGYAVKGLQPFMAMDIYQNLGLSLAHSSPDPLLWLAKKQLNKEPYFLWYHYVHTHLPYSGSGEQLNSKGNQVLPGTLTREVKKRLLKVANQTAVHFDEAKFEHSDIPLIRNLQKPSIQQFDQWFKELWEFYNSGGFRDNTILILTADHGDEHGERHMTGHASTTLAGHLHEEIVRVPLFIWVPDRTATKSVGTGLTSSHLDVMPTMFSLLGLQPEKNFAGIDLFSPTASASKKRAWHGMTSSGGFAEPVPEDIQYYEYGYVQENWKTRLRIYNDNSGEQIHWLYDLSTDPGELHNLVEKRRDIAEQHQSALHPLIKDKITRPVAASALEEEFITGKNKTASKIQWIHPQGSRSISYDKLQDQQGQLYLKWSGSQDSEYIIEYRAGHGRKSIKGTLKNRGNIKTFDNISRLYWQTWIVPASPFSLRVKEVGGPWSEQITLEAVP